ncbi:MAG: hypothetical protein E6K65_09730, partial [Nitrospirae bacterium]
MERTKLKRKGRKLGLNFCLYTFAFCLALQAQPAHAFTIVEPAEGAKLTSGTTVTARVDLGKDSGIIQIRYYWYG